MNAKERLQHFIDGINRYIEAKNLSPPRLSEEFKEAEEFTLEDMNKLTQDECFNYAYMLYQYADHINTEKGQQDIVLDWCEKALIDIIARGINDFDQYTKHDIKVATILQENSVAEKISEWKIVAESRIKVLGNKEYIVRKKADCLIEKGRRK